MHTHEAHLHACRAGGIITYGGQWPTLGNGTYPARIQHLPLPSPASIPLSHPVRGGSSGTVITALKGCRKKSALALKGGITTGANVKSVLTLAFHKAQFTSSQVQHRDRYGALVPLPNSHLLAVCPLCPSLSRAQSVMSHEGANCWMTSKSLRHAPTLRGWQDTE